MKNGLVCNCTSLKITIYRAFFKKACLQLLQTGKKTGLLRVCTKLRANNCESGRSDNVLHYNSETFDNFSANLVWCSLFTFKQESPTSSSVPGQSAAEQNMELGKDFCQKSVKHLSSIFAISYPYPLMPNVSDCAYAMLCLIFS